MSEGEGAKKGFLENVTLNLSPKVGTLNHNLDNVWRHFLLSQLGQGGLYLWSCCVSLVYVYNRDIIKK